MKNKTREWAVALGLPPEATFIHFQSKSNPHSMPARASTVHDLGKFLDQPEPLPAAMAAIVDLRDWPDELRARDLAPLWRALRTAMPAHGRIVLLGRNPVYLRRLMHTPGKVLMFPQISALRQQLRRSGFSITERFLLLPDAETPKAFIRPRKHLAWLFPGAHPVKRFLLRMGLVSGLHDGYVLLAGSTRIEENATFKRLSRVANESDPSALELEKFNIRDRGSVMLFAQSSRTKRGLVGRITLEHIGREIAHRNHKSIESLRERLKVAPELQALIPTPFLHEDIPGGSLFVEETLPGLLAWQLPDEHARENSYRQAREVLADIENTLGETRTCTDELITHLIQADLDALALVPDEQEPLRSLTVDTLQAIRNRLMDKQIRVAPSHGDFGLGNVMADPRTGNLTGVIDWGTTRFEDLAGIDAVNLELQQYSASNGCDLATAALAVLEAPSKPVRLPNENALPLALTVALAIVRFVTRDAPHADILAKRAAEYTRALQQVLDLPQCREHRNTTS